MSIPSRRAARIPMPLLLLLTAAAGPATSPAPTPVGGVWIGSEAAVRDAAEQLGLPLPPAASLATLEQTWPFLRPGELRTDAPVGAVFSAGEGFTAQQMFAFALPVPPGGVPLSRFDGAQKTDAPDTVAMGPMAFRRTGDYLVVGGSVPAAVASDPTALATPLVAAPAAGPGGPMPLLRASVDLAAWRSVAPTQFAAVMDAWHAQNGDRPDAADPGRAAGAAWIERVVRTDQDRLAVAVDRTPQGWTATTHFEPAAVPVRRLPRPRLPADCVARLDLQVSADAVRRLMNAVAENPQTDAAENAVAAHVVAVCLAGDAESYGLARGADGRPVLYAATARATPADLSAELAAVAREGAAGPGVSDAATVPYTAADGHTVVHRFTLHDHGTVVGYLDVAEANGFRYATLSQGSAHSVEALLPLGPDGADDVLAGGWVDPGPAVAVLSALPAVAAGLPAEKRDRLVALLGDARLSWSARPAGRGVDVVADLPAKLLAAVGPAVRELRD